LFSKLNKKWTLALLSVALIIPMVLSACSGKTTATTVTATQTSTVTATTTPVTITATQTSIVTATQTSTVTATTAATYPKVTSASVPLTNLNSAGATFPTPLYTKWFSVYNTIYGVQINYQAVGSGSGINQITAGTVDFGASDGIMTDAQVAAAETAHGPILAIPMTSAPVAIIYNLSGITTGLKLTGDVLAKIYLKTITKWNDPAITALNPGVPPTYADIAVVHRSDSSGTTYIFTNYLTKINTDWSTKIGNATSVNWVGDIGGQGNAGVAAMVQQTPNSIGYVDLTYAIQNGLSYATLQNASGNWIAPSVASATAASTGITLPDNMKIMITNSTNAQAYPIVGFTWILAYVNQADQAKGVTLARMLWWAIHEGQQYNEVLGYASLSPAAVTKAENEILSMKYQGQPILALSK